MERCTADIASAKSVCSAISLLLADGLITTNLDLAQFGRQTIPELNMRSTLKGVKWLPEERKDIKIEGKTSDRYRHSHLIVSQ